MGANLAVAAVVGGSVLLALLGLAAVRRLVPPAALKPHTDVVAAVYAALGVVYGVILGQVVVAAWDQYEQARAAATAEAASLVDLVRLAEGFPEPERRTAQGAALAYGRAVVDEEWSAMARGRAPSPGAAAGVAALFRVYGRMAAGPVGPGAPYAASLAELDELDDARGARLLASARGLPGLMWAVLVAGGGLTVGFAYLLGVESRLVHALMVAALAAVVALLLALTQALSTPFRDPLRIPPDGFARALERAEQDAAPDAGMLPRRRTDPARGAAAGEPIARRESGWTPPT